jgi:hypothetical protein
MKKYFLTTMFLMGYSIHSNASWLENMKSFVNDKIEALKQKWEQLEQQEKQKYDKKQEELNALQIKKQKQQELARLYLSRLSPAEHRQLVEARLSPEDIEKIKHATPNKLPVQNLKDIGFSRYASQDEIEKNIYEAIKNRNSADFLDVLIKAKHLMKEANINKEENFNLVNFLFYLFQYGIGGTKFIIGTTPLHVAAYFENFYVLDSFLSSFKLKTASHIAKYKDAWINAEIHGLTALDCAEFSKYGPQFKEERKQCIDLLKSHGARNGSFIVRRQRQAAEKGVEAKIKPLYLE